MKTRLFSCAKSLPLSSLAKEESTLSPFRLFSNETLQELPAPAGGGPVFLSDENKIEKLLVFLVANLCFTTSELLLEAMKNMEIHIEKKHIQNTLKKLHRQEFLLAFHFHDAEEEGRSACKIYACGWRGYGLLKEKHKQTSIGYCKRLIETNDVPAIKRILSAQQFALRKKKADPETLSVAQCVFASDRNGNALPNAIFRANAMVKDGEQKITIIDSIRQNEGWQKELRSKLHRLKRAFNHPKQNVEGFRRENVSLVLVCENAVHMQKAMDYLQKNISIGIPLKFTTDPLVYSSHEYLYAVKPSLFSTLFSA